MSRIVKLQEGPGPRRGRGTLLIAVMVGLVVGAGAGSLVVGPLIADPSAGGEIGPMSAAELEAQCQVLFEEWGVDVRSPAPAAVYTIENIVLNPAQSGGTRFLMASVGFGMRDASDAAVMAARDAEVRDIVIRVLGARTVAELADTNQRNKLKDEMHSEVARLVGQRAVRDIYFPQFVIQ